MYNLHPEAVDFIETLGYSLWPTRLTTKDNSLESFANRPLLGFCKQHWGAQLLPFGSTDDKIAEDMEKIIDKAYKDLDATRAAGGFVDKKLPERPDMLENLTALVCEISANEVIVLADNMKTVGTSTEIGSMDLIDSSVKCFKVRKAARSIRAMMVKEMVGFKSVAEEGNLKAKIDSKK